MESSGSRIIFFSLFALVCFFSISEVFSVQILSKSKLEKCERSSGSNAGDLNCTTKILINMAVPSGSSGGESSIVAEVAEVEGNSTDQMQTLRAPPLITINKTAAYALYELTYIRDVPYKPEEYYVRTRKCEPDADEKVVKICERLYDSKGHVIQHTQPVCCPCGGQRRVPSSCGNFFDKLLRGKANTAHCVRFPGDWFHVFGIGKRTIGFTVRIEVKSDSKVSNVVVGPENRTATSSDNFLRVNLVGDFAGYSSVPAFEDFYLVIPRQGEEGQPQDLGKNISMWMLLERVRFTLDGLECDKIGVSYEAFNGQPSFCSSPLLSCLHNQLWNFYEADQNRLNRNQMPLYGVERRFERINRHPNAGSHSFSIGVTEVINTNLLIELRADDIDYVYQRSPGKICSITTPTFEALSQVGTSTITTMNTGEVEASYSLTFSCSQGVTIMEEQFFIMKPQETTSRSFKINPTTDHAAKYTCTAILKDSEFKEVHRADCQFTTTATTLDNGTQPKVNRSLAVGIWASTIWLIQLSTLLIYMVEFQKVGHQTPLGLSSASIYSGVSSGTTTMYYGIVIPFEPPKPGTVGFFDSLKELWNKFWKSLVDFITGKSCRSKCREFFDFSCHIQYVCMSWIILFGLFLAIFPTVLVLLWLLHEYGLFDPFYDWWEAQLWDEKEPFRAPQRRTRPEFDDLPMTHRKHTKTHPNHKNRHHHHHDHEQQVKEGDNARHVRKDKHRHHGHRSSIVTHQRGEHVHRHHRRRRVEPHHKRRKTERGVQADQLKDEPQKLEHHRRRDQLVISSG